MCCTLKPFIPQPGKKGGLGLAVLTYADNVAFSVLCDADLVEGGPNVLTEEFDRQFQAYLDIANNPGKWEEKKEK